MPNVNITVSNIRDKGTGAGGGNSRAAAYAPGTGNPAWAVVGDKGDIDVALAPSGQGQGPAVNLVFTLNSPPQGVTFHATAPFSPVGDGSDFAVVSGGGTTTLTVSDTNSDGVVGTEHSYTLTLSDDSTLDPMVINR